MKKELEIPSKSGFCKNCFNNRRDGSAYCGKCDNSYDRIIIYTDKLDNFPRMKEAKKKFPNIKSGVVITYGDIIYTDYELSYGLISHEITHVLQQEEIGKDVWWDKYLEDNNFMLDQEAKAYGNQYKVYKKTDVREAESRLNSLAGDLSGKVYNNHISFKKAKELIKL